MRRPVFGLLSMLLFSSIAAPARAGSDWFGPFRGFEAYVVEDTSWLAKDPAAVEGAPLLKIRHLLILFRTDGGNAGLWPRRNLLLIEVPGGGKWATELGEGDLEHRGDARPWTRISNGRAVLEGWITGEESDKHPGGEDPCGGSRLLVRGGGEEAEFFGADGATKSVKTQLRELREAALSDGERKELELFRRLRIPDADAPPRLLAPEAAWDLVALTAPEEKSVVLVPDAERDPDLAPWNAITWIPSPLSPMDLPGGL